jgi:hypothetical protein
LKKQLLFLLPFVLFACKGQTNQPVNTGTYVDIHAFFESEVARLTQDSFGVYKRTRMDSTSNADSTDNPDWSKELYAFLDFNIKPTVWTTDFTKIEVEHDPNEVSDVYETTNSKQKIKTFKLKLNATGDIIRFSTEIIEKGKIANTTTLLSYTKDVGYSLKVDRQTKIMGNEFYQIVGQFYRN